MEYQRLYRSRKEKIIAGVAGGLGEFFKIDPVIIRILFVLVAVMAGGGGLIYILLWIFVPYKDNADFTTYDTFTAPKSEPYAEPVHEQTQANTQTTPNATETKDQNHQFSGGSIIGAVVLITVGMLFLADNFISLDFSKYWPVILIVIGVILLFSNNKFKINN
jgi:phage shock protein C